MATRKDKGSKLPERSRRRRNAAGHAAARNAISLDDLIDVYRTHFSQGRAAELTRYKKDIQFSRALELAAKALIPAPDRVSGFSREPHQWRLKAANLKQGYLELKELRLDLLSAHTFERLLTATKRVAKSIDGLGEMWAFDTAFRLSIFFDCEPKDIYLHAGCRKGAASILGHAKGEFVSIRSFGKLKKLGPAHLESFLCTLKDYLHPKLLG